ncbi:exonuclease 1 [Anopheles nili]|uniref:exonuclease 1 n=1 Tax=Anopheles nili TaxID=185578 RepID=UPI00237BFD5C|nr:exonuclease 1 [Anopheles nili]
MGITGLLNFLEKASSACHLRDLRGKCVAIDSYCWLHRGAFGCADRLARGESTDAHIQYCLKFVQLLLSHNIKPILVFDGQHLPAKAATEAKRRETRENARKRGAELLRQGRIDEARSFLRRCVDITHEMALQLIQECRKRGVDCIVAPYEADAQLAYLNRMDIAQYVITEDSDLVLFGCNRILFKLDLTGNARLVDASKLHLAMGCREEKYNFARFRHMCILSGCDYLDSLPGIGLGKACRFMLKTEDPDIRRALAKIPSYLNMRQLTVPEEYKDEFLKADATFKHMVVYDPVQRKQTRLVSMEEEGTAEEYCCNAGTFSDEKIALELAMGNLNPFSLQQMDDWHPDAINTEELSAVVSKRLQQSIWRKDYYELKETQVTRSESVPSLLKSFVKRPPPNVDFAELGTKDTIGDILQAYGIEENNCEPPLKRLCSVESPKPPAMSTVAIEYNDLEVLESMATLEQPKTPKRNRNPFVVSSAGQPLNGDRRSEILSPTKITPENRSLLQNVSPVRRIEYSQHRSQAFETTTHCTSRLNRNKPATGKSTGGGSGAQRVISRFFCSQTTAQASATSNSSPEGKEAPVAFTAQSPTAIVKEIKDMRNANALMATSLYLSSPEAQPQNRGERTPEKRQLLEPEPCKSATIARFDSGIAMSEEDKREDESETSSSQKENDDTLVFGVDKVDSNPKLRTARLALFERKPAKSIMQTRDCAAEELAIVLDDDDDDEDDEKKHIGDAIGEGIKSAENLSETNPVRCNAPGSAPKVQLQSSGRRLGMAVGRKKPSSKTQNSCGLTQSRLSMFGFQKKPSMQMEKR